MNKPTYQIKEITNIFKSGSFPRNKIPKDLTIYFDIIFSKVSDPPKKDHLNDNVKDYYPYLIFDEKYKKVSFNNNTGGWKSTTETTETNNFFDNFKGKFNQSDVQSFKRNAEMSCSNAVDISIASNRLLDHIENPNQKQLLGSEILSVDDFFNNYDEQQFRKGNYSKIPIIDCIYRVNERINYPKNKPLWYVYHAEADSSYGPLSSEDIEQMINSKLLEPESKIRLIDAFVVKGCKQFDFFMLKDVQLENFIDNLCVSSLVYNFKVSNKNLFKKIDLHDMKDEIEGTNKSKYFA